MDWGRILEIVLAAVALPLLGWIAITLSKINTVLFGATGDNGLRGDVISLRASRHEHGEKLKVLELQQEYHHKELNERLNTLEHRA